MRNFISKWRKKLFLRYEVHIHKPKWLNVVKKSEKLFCWEEIPNKNKIGWKSEIILNKNWEERRDKIYVYSKNFRINENMNEPNNLRTFIRHWWGSLHARFADSSKSSAHSTHCACFTNMCVSYFLEWNVTQMPSSNWIGRNGQFRYDER